MIIDLFKTSNIDPRIDLTYLFLKKNHIKLYSVSCEYGVSCVTTLEHTNLNIILYTEISCMHHHK